MTSIVSQLGYVGLEVSDMARWRSFAREILGLEERSPAGDDAVRLRLDEKHHRIALHRGPKDDIAYAGWQVDDRPGLESVARRLASLGFDVRWGTPQQAQAREVSALFHVVDPNGVASEIYCGATAAPQPFSSPRGLSGFEAGELGLGHIVLCVDDYEAALSFYRDGLGLKTSDFIDIDLGDGNSVTAAFLHAGPRHHSLALLPLSLPKRLHHLMLEVTNIDDVGTTHDLCVAGDIPIARGLGRHTNDQMVSFYMQSPSGFEIEFGYGGVLIDDDSWQVRSYDAPSIWGHHPQP